MKKSQKERFKYYFVLLNTMKTITVKLPDSLLGEMDSIIKQFHYGTRSEFIREAIRIKLTELKNEEKPLESEEPQNRGVR